MTSQNVSTISSRMESVSTQCNETITWGYNMPAVRTTAYILAFLPILVLLLNAMAVFYIVRARRFKRHTRIFILSLTLSDMLVAVIVLPFRLYDMLAYGPVNKLMCKIGNSFDVFLSFVSICTIAILAFDRYITTCRPFEVGFWFRGYNSMAVLVCTWMIPAGLGFVFIPLNLTIKGVEREYECLTEKTRTCLFFTNVPFAVALTILFVCLSAFVIICNRLTLCGVKKRTKIFYKVIFSTKPIPVYRSHFGSKIARMIIWMTSCFILCWVPFFTVNVIDQILGHRVPGYIWIAVIWMAYANCALNPVLYLTFTGVLKF